MAVDSCGSKRKIFPENKRNDKISNKNWKQEHWNTIKHSYSKANCFKDYKDFFEELYLNCNLAYLSEINFRFLKGICDLLGINTKFKLSSEFKLRGDKSEKLLNICLDDQASVYYSGPAAKNYLAVDLFEKNNVQVKWFDYSGYKEHEQLYPPFQHGVSIVDLLFNTGKEAVTYMKSFQDGD